MRLTATILRPFGSFSLLAWQAGCTFSTKFLPEKRAANASEGTVAGQKAFNALRLIVTVGWAIYPLGYIYGYAGGGDVAASTSSTT